MQIGHVPGGANSVADALSRVEEVSLAAEFSLKDLTDEQVHDPELQLLVTNGTSSLTLEDIDIRCDLFLATPQMYPVSGV